MSEIAPPVSDEPAVIRATFSDYRTVKGRKVLQIVMEVPLEQQALVFDALGYPVPDKDIWCAIARLAQPTLLETVAALRAVPGSGWKDIDDPLAELADIRGGHAPPITRSEAGKQRYASASDMEKALIRAARLPKDARFRQWIAGARWNGSDDDAASEHTAIKHIRDTCCAGESRKLIAKDRSCFDAFIRMEASFLIETNQMAEPR